MDIGPVINNQDCIILHIRNDSKEDVANVAIFDTSTLDAPNFGLPSSIEILVKNFGFTYRDLLQYLKTNQIKVISTYVQSCSTSQVFEPSEFKNGERITAIRPFIEQSFEDVLKYDGSIGKISNVPSNTIMKHVHDAFNLAEKSVIVIKQILAYSTQTIYYKFTNNTIHNSEIIL